MPPVLTLTEFSREALHILRDPSLFSWTTVPLLAFAIYIYAVEVERRNWDAVLAGLALWSVDWIAEVVNALVLHFTDHAAIWTTTGRTSFQILIGLNIEISLMFFVAGVVFVKALPRDKRMKVIGVPNRALLVLAWSCFAVFVEVLLHATGYFHWPYPWWDFPNVWLIVIFGYGTFFATAALVYDMRARSRQLWIVGSLLAVAAGALLVFGPALEWI